MKRQIYTQIGTENDRKMSKMRERKTKRKGEMD